MKYKASLAVATLITLAGLLSTAATVRAEVSWQRQAYGQGPFYPPNRQGDPGYAFYYPNNNNWSQELTFAYDGNPPKPVYVIAPSNWSTDTYPRSGDVTLGKPACNLDRFVQTGGQGGVLTLNSLTVQADGQLNIEAGVRLTLSLLNLQGINGNDATITNNGGGGALPVLILTPGGTLKKTTGNSSYTLDTYITLQVPNGGTIAADTGALQLPHGAYAGGVNFNAATGALIDLAPADAVDSGVIQLTGAFTGINTGGTVRLNKGWLGTVPGTGGATLNFGGDTFQWQGGRLRGTAADPFTNLGTINVTGAVELQNEGGFINQGTVAQSGAGTLNILGGYGLFTNSAGAVYDIRNNLVSPIGGGGFFSNSGTVRKSGGTGTSTVDANLHFNNIGGTIRVDSGTLALGSGLVTDGGPGDGGIFQVAAGATLQLDDGTTNVALYNGTYTGAGAGTVLLSSGRIGAVRFYSGATFNLPGAMFQWTGGEINSGVGTPFTNAGTVTIAGPVTTYNYGGRFTNTGTVIQSGGGSMTSAPGGIINAAGGLYDIRNDLGFGSDQSFSGNQPLTNAGTFQKSAGSGTSIIDTGFATFDNSGTINAASGTLQFTSLIQSAGTIKLNGGNLSSPNDITLNGGSLVGSGNITGNLRNNGGNVAPGYSPGTINISGFYAQGANGSLTMEIGGATPGSGYDQLVVSGQASLNGTLNVTLINGFRPQVGDTFQLIALSSFTGSFATINTSGFTGQVNYSSNGVTLTVLTVADIPVNIATRIRVLPDPNQLIGGFIINGTEPKTVVIRAIGPSLSSFFSGVLADPTLELFQGTNQLASNNNWKDTDQAAIEATQLAPKNDLESAIVRTLAPGAYTAIVRDKNGRPGIGLVEVYDVSKNRGSQLANIASRGFVDTDDNVMIGGFIIGGNGGANGKVVVRAVGPSLKPFGIDNALADPTLELRDANGSLLQGNDNWKDTQQAEISATGLAPSDDKESALLAALPDGSYTAIMRGKGNTTGVGVVEVYTVK